VVSKDLDSQDISCHLCRTVSDLIRLEPFPQVIAIDIPIGLLERGSRDCDREARQLLGPGRASSVFPAPIRPILDAKNYRDACEIRFQIEGKKISRQTWAIMPKIRDVDVALQQDDRFRASVREVHPEMCFYFLSGGKPLIYSKKATGGRRERFQLLHPIFGDWLGLAFADRSQLASAEDDILDAFVALWTAERIWTGKSSSIPAKPYTDRPGLRMEMVA